MSLESRPTVVAFDGLHRTGKGTQAEKLYEALLGTGARSVIVRGDGTREGSGLHEGDSYSEEWQARSHRVKSPEGNTVEAWNAASYILARELSAKIHSNTNRYDAIIVDRSLLSRAAFLLHRGIGLKGTRFTLDEMYPDNATMTPENQIDLKGIVPDIIFDLQVESPKVLLSRLDPEDPKYIFRARNIRGGFDAAAIASRHLPEDIEERVETIDASASLEAIHGRVISRLGSTGLAAYFA